MPSFCVPAPGAPVSSGSTATELVAVTRQGWQELVAALCGDRTPDPGKPADFGRYRVFSRPPSVDRLVTPQFMRRLVTIVQQDARRAGLAESALIERLSRRLPV